MIEQIIGKTQTHSLKLFSQDEIDWLEGRIFKRQTKRGEEFAVKCFVREKEIKLTPEEVVRQLYAHLPPMEGLGLALYNRAIRAAAHTILHVD
jgi:hypothetical protein